MKMALRVVLIVVGCLAVLTILAIGGLILFVQARNSSAQGAGRLRRPDRAAAHRSGLARRDPLLRLEPHRQLRDLRRADARGAADGDHAGPGMGQLVAPPVT